MVHNPGGDWNPGQGDTPKGISMLQPLPTKFLHGNAAFYPSMKPWSFTKKFLQRSGASPTRPEKMV